MRFDPKAVERYTSHGMNAKSTGDVLFNKEVVLAEEYDKLLALYNQEREARKEDAKQFQRDLRDAYAEGDYNARNDAGTY